MRKIKTIDDITKDGKVEFGEGYEFVGTADTPDGGIVGIGRPAEVGQQKQRAVIIIQAQCIAVIIGTVLFQGIAVRISGFLVRVGAECIGCIEIKAIEDR